VVAPLVVHVTAGARCELLFILLMCGCVVSGEDLVSKPSRQVKETSRGRDGEAEAGSENGNVPRQSGVRPGYQSYLSRVPCRLITVTK